VYRDRTAGRCAVFVGKKYGSKGYPQRNVAAKDIHKEMFPGTCETVGQVFKFVWRLR
jgi:hypothetical protein